MAMAVQDEALEVRASAGEGFQEGVGEKAPHLDMEVFQPGAAGERLQAARRQRILAGPSVLIRLKAPWVFNSPLGFLAW
jgi:hypothetical protein